LFNFLKEGKIFLVLLPEGGEDRPCSTSLRRGRSSLFYFLKEGKIALVQLPKGGEDLPCSTS
jgi:hypothetical protein